MNVGIVDEFSKLQFVLGLVGLFAVGKLLSLVIYQTSWRNAIGRNLRRRGPILTALMRPTRWPLHASVGALTWDVGWEQLPILYQPVCVAVTLLTIGAVFRFSATDRRCFFVMDRLIVVALCVGVYVSPAFLYPSVFAACCLQYVVADWPLGPGYSNLLGFEFIRGLTCCMLGCVGFAGCWDWFHGDPPNMDALFLSVLITFQASYYVNHALAKSSLGPRWYSWIQTNRVDCLVVNAYLRGWMSWLGTDRMLRFAKLTGKLRVPLCASLWSLEFAFFFALADVRFAAILFIAAAAFHIGVWLLTGLAELEHVVNHISMATILYGVSQQPPGNGIAVVLTSMGLILITFLVVGLLRRRLLLQCQQSGAAPTSPFADPYDHLMAWWDSPYMRMFTWTVLTTDGGRWSLPVTKLSPYDTAITDIHTHMMILNQHVGFDPDAERDKDGFRSGVWGLVVSVAERDRLYQWMDRGDSCVATQPRRELHSSACHPSEQTLPQVDALRQLFQAVNVYCDRRWFRFVMMYPHFPGEDWVPDICPLITPHDERYRFDRPIASVLIQRIKTFYDGNEIHLLEQSDMRRIEIESTDL